ncbi:hypothetical protein F2P56_021795 [Juglans regia]|uniref:Mitochondrial intermediate peptidase, mitochondrial n=1 Tax=Juglans regia TaxID=51240 RepID=A0A833UH06_JUGRE|nr:hypothetical protein F2P56_021795 [Juglans regia]
MWSLICRAARTLRPKHLLGSRSSDPSCTRHYRTSVVAPQTGASTGLYGFDHLKSPKGFQRFVDDAIERSGELVAYISSMPSSAKIIRAMDEISDTVCSVVDSAELCRNTHPDREFTEEANKAAMRINEYLHVSISIPIMFFMMRSEKLSKRIICSQKKLKGQPITYVLTLRGVESISLLIN